MPSDHSPTRRKRSDVEQPLPDEQRVRDWLAIDGLKENWQWNLNEADFWKIPVDPIHRDIALLLGIVVGSDSVVDIQRHLYDRHSILPSDAVTLSELLALLQKDAGGRQTPRTPKTERSEGDGGDGSTPGQPAVTSSAEQDGALRQLEPAVRKAYLAYQYAETMNGRRLEDREAYDLLKEIGIDEGKGNLGELTDYKLPESLETFKRYLASARKPLGENKYTQRVGRKYGGSIVPKNQIE